jgi:hypothetical protein
MTEPLPCVVISYSRFLEYQDRRRRIAAVLISREGVPAIDLPAVPVPAAVLPAPGAESRT